MKTIAVVIAFALTGSVWAEDPKPDPVAAGKLIVEKKKCSICHAVDGKGGKKEMKPMNGITEGKTDDYLKGSLLDPKKTIKADTKMPAYKITDEEVAAVIAYMKSLKKQ